MRAIVLEGFDEAPRLVRRPVPEVGDEEVLVRVHAASLNSLDRAVVAGVVRGRMDYRFPVTVGRDFAGVVTKVGAGVSRWKPGDEVFGFLAGLTLHHGTFADYVVVGPEAQIARKPPGVGFTAAAAVPLAAVTALLAVEAVAPQQGERVLVTGAAGGVGSFAVQLASLRGAEVLATGRPQDERYLRRLGASEIVPRDGDLHDSVAERHPGGVEALVDLVHDAEGFLSLTELLRAGGRAASTRHAAPNGGAVPRRVTAANVLAAFGPPRLPEIADLIERGRLHAVVQRVCRLEEVLGELVAETRAPTRGKLVAALATPR
jgi:NADPH:quinone reductase